MSKWNDQNWVSANGCLPLTDHLCSVRQPPVPEMPPLPACILLRRRDPNALRVSKKANPIPLTSQQGPTTSKDGLGF